MSVFALDYWPKVEMPDRVGYVTAYRTWILITEQGRYGLASYGLVGKNCIWTARKPLEARCYRTNPPDPMACDERCKKGWQFGRCGIYGIKSMGDKMFHMILRFPKDYSSLAIGAVALWGVVLEHERGYRAQFATPLWITRQVGLKHAICDIARDYGIPLRDEWREL